VEEYIKCDIPLGLVYQSNEYQSSHQPILFEQTFDRLTPFQPEVDDEVPTPGVREDSCTFENLSLRSNSNEFIKEESKGYEEETTKEAIHEDSLDSSYDSELENKEKHIIFMMHGYMSDPEDLDKILSAIRIKSPLTSIHCIESIEHEKNKGILEMGEIAAQE